MSSIESSPRWLTELDLARLLKLTQGHPPPLLAELLDAADVVAPTEVAPDVVTMHSRLRVSEAGAHHELIVCYPVDADPNAGRVSVLSPVGTALLGRRVGDWVTSRSPTGSLRHLNIEAILFQPEATGDYLS